MFQQLLKQFLQKFVKNMGRGPQNPAEWMQIQDEAVRYLNKTKGAPSIKKDVPPFQGWNPKVIEGGKPKKGIEGLMKSGDVQFGTAPKTPKLTLDRKKEGLEGQINKEKWIARKQQENKDAIRRFKEKNPKTVEDFRDKGDWDPGGMAQGGIAPLVGEPSYAANFYDDRTPMEKGKLVYGMENKPVDILEDFTKYPEEAKGIIAANEAAELAKDKERWKNVLKYDSNNPIDFNSRHYLSMFRNSAPKKIQKLLDTTILQLTAMYPGKKPETMNDIKELINQASVEGKLEGKILGSAISLTKVFDAVQDSTKINIKSPILNVEGDIDRDKYNISKDLKLGNVDLGYKTTFDEGKQTGSTYSLDVPLNYKDLESNIGLKRRDSKYNTSDLLSLDSTFNTGNLTAGLTGNVEKDKYGITTALEPSLKYDIPTDYGTLSASASKNIIEGGDPKADLSYTWGDSGHPSDEEQFWRISANLDPVEGDKKAFIGFKSKFAQGGRIGLLGGGAAVKAWQKFVTKLFKEEMTKPTWKRISKGNEEWAKRQVENYNKKLPGITKKYEEFKKTGKLPEDMHVDDLTEHGISNNEYFRGYDTKKLRKKEVDYDYYREILDDAENEVVHGDETLETLEGMVKEQQDYHAYMYDQYKTGKLEPKAGEVNRGRLGLLRERADEAYGDPKMFTHDDYDELEYLEDHFKQVDKEEAFLSREAKEMARGKASGSPWYTDPKILSPEAELRKEFPGIDDNMIKNILTDKNPQRIAEVKQTMREALEMQQKGMSPEGIIKTLKDTSRKKNADGGIIRAGFPFGGQALKAIRQAWRANKDWGVGGPPFRPEKTSFNIKEMTKRTLGDELSLTDLRRLSESPLAGPQKGHFEDFNRQFKNIKASILKEKMMERKLEAKAAINAAEKTMKEAIADPQKYGGNLEMSRRITDQMTRESKETLKEVREGLKEIDIYMGMLQKKGRSVHAEGGRIGYSGGGKAGLPAVTMGTPQMNMQQPQMPAGPQPAGIPGGTIVAQNQMQQSPWMGSQMQQGPGGMPRPQPQGQPRMPFGLGGMTRRAFMKLMAGVTAGGVAAGTGLLKLGKAAKVVPKVTETIVQSNAAGMPAWFPSLVKRVIKEGEDITGKAGAMERQTVHSVKLPESGTPVQVTRDLVTDDIIVDIGEQTKHGWSAGRHGQPTQLILKKGEWIEPTKGKKGIKTKDEFTVDEAEFTGGHPENVKFEETVQFKYGDHGSDFSEIEQFATKSPVTSGSSSGEVKRALRREGWYGKKEKARQLGMDKKYGGLKSTYKKDPHVRGKQADLDDWAEGRAESQAEDIDYASGGLARMLGE